MHSLQKAASGKQAHPGAGADGGRVAYVNFLSDEGPERVRAAYGPEKFARLQAVKDAYDPHNVFALNQNIPPSAEIRLQPNA